MLFADQWFYFLYFQEPGRAEAELDGNVEAFLRAMLYTISGDAPHDWATTMVGGPKTGTMLPHLLQPDVLPPWLGADDLALYVAEFSRTGFRGGLNWYRCADASWELTAAWSDVRIRQPALFIAGDRDGVVTMMPGAVEAMRDSVPGLRGTVLLPGCGHWTQQERPTEVSEALLEFLRGL
jgi:pimeloyl-ACP methyl ester carboxylesterase